MLTDYTMETEVNSYSSENVKRLFKAMKNGGRKIKEVGRCFNIQELILQKICDLSCPTPPVLSQKSGFSMEGELEELKDYIFSLYNLFYVFTSKTLWLSAFRYVGKKN